MDNNSLNALIDNLDSVNDNSIPPWALILLQCMKGVINGYKVIDDLVQRVIILEDFKTVNEILRICMMKIKELMPLLINWK